MTDTLAAEGRRLLEASERLAAPLPWSHDDRGHADIVDAECDPVAEAVVLPHARLITFAVNNLPELLTALEERDALRSLLKEAGEGLEATYQALYGLECSVRHGGVKRGDAAQLEARKVIDAYLARSLSTRIREVLGSVASLPGINHAPANRPTAEADNGQG